MVTEISTATRTEVLGAIRSRYREASKRDKSRMLGEFVAMAGCHRKHAVRLLGQHERSTGHGVPNGRRIYDDAVRQALIVVWEASDRICGKRLKAALPSMVQSLERHGHLDLDPDVRERLFSASASTLDRLLRPVREQAGSRRRLKKRRKMGSRVPVRTFLDWNEPGPGYLEIDLVAHGGGAVSGAFIHSLVATDISSGWTEAVPLLAREQSLVVEGLEAISGVFPVPVRGIDSDNDSVFINETLVGYCEENEIEFTRSRAYRKNDQAWIEQKNGSVIRRFVGHERHSGAVAGQTMAHLYGAVRLYVNYFQPSFQLLAKSRNGGSVTKRYSKPATPCDRLLDRDDVGEDTKRRLRRSRSELDPVSLLHSIRESQSALAAVGSVESGGTPDGESLESFLSQLPDMWRQGEVRPTHARRARAARTWRTRPDPFDGVWCEVLGWLQQQPDTPASELMDRLILRYPDRYSRRQLRTLQRRVSRWRGVMAKQLVYASAENSEINEERPVDIGPVGVN